MPAILFFSQRNNFPHPKKNQDVILCFNFIHSNYSVAILAPHAHKLLGTTFQSKLAILSALANYSSIVGS